MASFVRMLLSALVLCLAVLLALENAEELKHTIRFTCDFFVPGWKFVTPPIPVFFVILVAFILGLLYSWLNGLIAFAAARSEAFFLEKKVKTLERELAKPAAEPPPAETCEKPEPPPPGAGTGDDGKS